MEGSYFGEGFK